jgi:hypothetical protein
LEILDYQELLLFLQSLIPPNQQQDILDFLNTNVPSVSFLTNDAEEEDIKKNTNTNFLDTLELLLQKTADNSIEELQKGREFQIHFLSLQTNQNIHFIESTHI